MVFDLSAGTDPIYVSHLSSAGCTLCDRAYPSDCPDHGPVTFVPDTPIESRARLSLPKQLVLRQSIVGADVGKTLGTIKLDQSLFFLCRVQL